MQLRSKFLSTAVLMLASGITVGCSCMQTAYDYPLPTSIEDHQLEYAQCADAYTRMSSIDNVAYFNTGSYRLTVEGAAAVQEASAMIKSPAFCGNHVVIVGYTDGQGSQAANLGLSQRRALTVKEALIHHGVNSDMLSIESLGKNDPADSNETNDGRANNRRVAFEVR